MERCKYELCIEEYFGLNPENTQETTVINTDFGHLCNLLAMFDQCKKGKTLIISESVSKCSYCKHGKHDTKQCYHGGIDVCKGELFEHEKNKIKEEL